MATPVPAHVSTRRGPWKCEGCGRTYCVCSRRRTRPTTGRTAGPVPARNRTRGGAR